MGAKWETQALAKFAFHGRRLGRRDWWAEWPKLAKKDAEVKSVLGPKLARFRGPILAFLGGKFFRVPVAFHANCWWGE